MKVCQNCLNRGSGNRGHAYCWTAGGYVARKQSACSRWQQNPRCPKAEVEKEAEPRHG